MVKSRLLLWALLAAGLGGFAPVAAARFAVLPCRDLWNACGVTGGRGSPDLDGQGNAYDGAAFPPPGVPFEVEGVPFLPERDAAGLDHHVPDGSSVSLPPGTRRLYMLGARTLGSAGGTIEVLQAGRDWTAVPLLVGDWCEEPLWGERIAVSMPHRWTPAGAETRSTYLFAVSIELPHGTMQVRFPPNRCMHLFALTADTGARPLWSTPPGAEQLGDRIPPLSNPLPEAAPVRGDLHLGFVLHWNAPGRGAYTASGSHSMLANLFFWNMRDQERQFVHFRPAEEWLAYLYRHGLQSAVIVDTSIHHTSIPWRSEATRQLGENICDQSGRQTQWSSPFSPRYREMVTQYAGDLTEWISRNDVEHRVRAYVNGAEVFWPGQLDFGPMAEEPFRDWLIGRYGSLDAINNRWGAGFATLEEIRPPPFRRLGTGVQGAATFVYGDWQDGGWTCEITPLQPGTVYEGHADVRAEGVLDGLVSLQLVWTAEGRPHEAAVGDTTGETAGSWRTLAIRARAPDWAEHGTLVLSLQGPGRVVWRAPRLARAFVDGDLLPPVALDAQDEVALPPGWSASVWHGNVRHSAEDLGDGKGPALVIEGTPVPHPWKHPAAAWHDFVTFSMESYAETMDHWARTLKSLDPSREVMHYLGFLLGTLSQWDDLTFTQRPDIALFNARSVDINGLQLCAANGDFHYATVVLDLARKYGKPMVATDLQDFTHGLYVGFNSLNRTTLACVAHGVDGIYWYCWEGTPDYNWYGTWPPEETARMVGNAEAAIRFLEGFEPETSVAFLVPILPYSDADPGGQKADMLDAMGWYKLLMHSGLCPDVYTPYELARWEKDPLSACRVVFVPDCPFLPADAAYRLWDYVERGGVLVLGGRPPHRDEVGVPLPRPLLPVETATTLLPRPAGSRIVTGDRGGEDVWRPHGLPGGTRLAGAATLTTAAGAWSGLLSEQVGAGSVIWTGGMDGKGYLGRVRRGRVAGNTPPLYLSADGAGWPRPEGAPLLELVSGILADAAAEPSVRIEPPDPTVEVVAFRRGNERRAILIHTGRGMHRGGVLVFDRSGEGVPTVRADFVERPVRVEPTDDGGAGIILPPFADGCLIGWPP